MQTGHAASTACHFDTATATNKGIGQLSEAYTGTPALKDYRRIHQYDALGRPSLTTQLLSDGSYTSKTDFDLWGRAITQTYQRNNDIPKVYGSRYNSFAYLYRIERGNLPLWQVASQDAAHRPTALSLGNGLTQSRSYNVHTGRMYDAQLNNGSGVLRLQEGYAADRRTEKKRSIGFVEQDETPGKPKAAKAKK